MRPYISNIDITSCSGCVILARSVSIAAHKESHAMKKTKRTHNENNVINIHIEIYEHLTYINYHVKNYYVHGK